MLPAETIALFVAASVALALARMVMVVPAATVMVAPAGTAICTSLNSPWAGRTCTWCTPSTRPGPGTYNWVTSA